MSISIAKIYFNRLLPRENEVNLQLPTATEVSGQTAEYLAEALHSSFNKKGQKAYCLFKDDSPIAQALNDKNEEQALADNIFARIQQAVDVESPPAETILVVACYKHLASDYLLAAALGVKDSVLLSESISPERSQYLDIANIQLAVQIDVSEYGINPDSDRAVAYIKGRVGRAVSDFMADAFAIDPKVTAKEATQKLVETVEDFIADNSADDNVSTVREITLDMMKAASEAGDFIEVKALSDEIEEKTGLTGLYDKAAEDEEFNESCPVYMSASKSLQKFFGQGGGMSLSFNRQLLGEHIHFDPIAKTLKFTKLPPNLLDALEKAND